MVQQKRARQGRASLSSYLLSNLATYFLYSGGVVMVCRAALPSDQDLKA